MKKADGKDRITYNVFRIMLICHPEPQACRYGVLDPEFNQLLLQAVRLCTYSQSLITNH